VSAERTSGLLLRLYPPGWRARYGDELELLILETSGGRVPWRTRLDVVRAAGRERLRDAGLAGDRPPAERMRGGVLLALCAWALFVVAGMVVQKLSEHWQSATPRGSRGLPAAAFDVLLAGAALDSVLVVAGVALVLPRLLAFVRTGGLRHVRRQLLVALTLSACAVPASVGVIVWADGLSAAARNGHDAAYGVAAGLWALLLACCLAAWTAVGVAVARRLDLSTVVLRVESLLAAGVAASMAAMTVATVVWWASLAHAAPWFFTGAPAGASGSVLAPPLLLVAGLLMVVATAAAGAGAFRALRAA
jgi:hypothetical protein